MNRVGQYGSAAPTGFTPTSMSNNVHGPRNLNGAAYVYVWVDKMNMSYAFSSWNRYDRDYNVSQSHEYLGTWRKSSLHVVYVDAICRLGSTVHTVVLPPGSAQFNLSAHEGEREFIGTNAVNAMDQAGDWRLSAMGWISIVKNQEPKMNPIFNVALERLFNWLQRERIEVEGKSKVDTYVL